MQRIGLQYKGATQPGCHEMQEPGSKKVTRFLAFKLFKYDYGIMAAKAKRIAHGHIYRMVYR